MLRQVSMSQPLFLIIIFIKFEGIRDIPVHCIHHELPLSEADTSAMVKKSSHNASNLGVNFLQNINAICVFAKEINELLIANARDWGENIREPEFVEVWRQNLVDKSVLFRQQPATCAPFYHRAIRKSPVHVNGRAIGQKPNS